MTGAPERTAELKALGLARSAAHQPVFEQALSDAAPEVRVMACRALGWLRSAAVVEALLGALVDASAAVRQSAAASLAVVGADAVAASAPGLAGVGAALQARLADGEGTVRAAAAQTLGWLRIEAAAAALRAVLAGDTDDAVRAQAARALGRLGDGAAIEALVGALGSKHAGLRHQAARSLAVLAPVATPATAASIAAALRERLTDPDAEVRIAALHALAALSAEEARAPAVAALGDANPGVRAAAAVALGRLGAASSELASALATEPHPEVRARLAEALAAGVPNNDRSAT